MRKGASADEADVRHALGLTADVADRDLARALVHVIAGAQLAEVRVSPDRDRDLREPVAPAVMTTPDAIRLIATSSLVW